ncbi:MAG TPA: tetratricopeptide repeat protein [Flavipsychrobacter sp.]|nr:tetratricopeptide repeat protein [Flavipsychrobacter sp.]
MNNAINITEEELEFIDRYLHQQLSETEQKIFDERLRTDPLWQQKVTEIRLLSTGIQENVLLEQLDQFHSHLTTVENKTKIIKINPFKRLSVAASILFFVGILSWMLFFRKSGDEKLYASYYQPDPGLPTVMGVSENYEFEKAMVDYKTGDYSKAMDAWKALLKTHPDNDTLNYFIGSAHLANDNSKDALVFFDKTLLVKNSVFRQEALWYKALALLKEGKKEDAIIALKAADHPDKEILLRKLEE